MEGVSVVRLVDIDVEEECPGLEDVPVGGNHLDLGLAWGLGHAVQQPRPVVLAVVVTQY